jgi:hypothetical protein
MFGEHFYIKCHDPEGVRREVRAELRDLARQSRAALHD